jgi:hypothetical protein
MHLPLFVNLRLGSGLAVLVSQAVLSAAIAGVPLGLSFGLIVKPPAGPKSIQVALAAVLLRLAFTVYALASPPHWVELLEVALLMALFAISAVLASRLSAASRRPASIAGWIGFTTVSLAALAFPWLYGCVVLGACNGAA